MSGGPPGFGTDSRVRRAHDFAKLAPDHLGRVLKIENLSFSSPWSAADFRCVVQDDRALCLGLWLGRELIGYVIGYVEDTGFHLASLAIDPTRRRQGWAGLLLRKILERAWQKGCRVCTLEVRASNRVAKQLYHRHGFKQVGVRSRYYVGPPEDALMMHRNIEIPEE